MGKLGKICAKRMPKCGPGVQVLFWGNKDSPKFKTESPKSKVQGPYQPQRGDSL